AGKQIRTLKTLPVNGVNRINWSLDRKSTADMDNSRRRGGRRTGFFEPSGGDALPGTYKVVFAFQEVEDETSINVYSDPRIKVNMEDLKAKEVFMKKLEGLTSEVSASTEKLDNAQKTIDKVLAITKDIDNEDAKVLIKAAKEVKKSLDKTREAFDGPTLEGQGIVRSLYPTTMTMVSLPRRYAGSSYSAPGPTEMRLFDQARSAADEAMAKVELFMNGDWKAFEEKVKATPIDIFEEVKKN
ncbi:MAG: hypothetical protein ACI9ZX_002637, partial [Algoriphagus sp.]